MTDRNEEQVPDRIADEANSAPVENMEDTAQGEMGKAEDAGTEALPAHDAEAATEPENTADTVEEEPAASHAQASADAEVETEVEVEAVAKAEPSTDSEPTSSDASSDDGSATETTAEREGEENAGAQTPADAETDMDSAAAEAPAPIAAVDDPEEPAGAIIEAAEASSADTDDEDASTAAAPVDDAPPSADTEASAPRVPFAEFGLPPALDQAIADLGFEFCTPIQAETLPHSLSGYDVTGQAQTGTGKTAAFLISIISHQLENPPEDEPENGRPRALIIAPTRELALQIAADAEALTQHLPWMNVVSVVGGMDFERQRKILESEIVDILVATPGRLIDFVTRGKVNLRKVEQVVLDEADRMLSMGFIPDVRRIIRQTPPKHKRQTLLFSATFNEEVLYLAKQWTDEPEHVVIEPETVATDNVDQRVYLVSSDDKFPLLYNLMSDLDLERVIVFANRRDTSREVQERLAALGVECELLSGEVPQHKRLKTLERFKNGSTRVLSATDVAGRGLHVEDISHVINYDLPEDPEDYVHRIGRTGRAGATGISISFVGEADGFLLPEIEELLGARLPCETPPEESLVAPDEPNRPQRDRRRGGPRRSGGGGGRGRSHGGRR